MCNPVGRIRAASVHPAIAPRHWRMRRERLIRPTVQSCRPDQTRQASHPAIAPPTGGCGVNALSALHVQSCRPIRRGKRRIRQLHRATGGCGVTPYPPYMCNPVGRIRRSKRPSGIYCAAAYRPTICSRLAVAGCCADKYLPARPAPMRRNVGGCAHVCQPLVDPDFRNQLITALIASRSSDFLVRSARPID